MIALKLWRERFEGCALVVNCDNKWVVSALNIGHTRDLYMAELLREVVFLLAHLGSVLEAHYIPSKQNVLLDLLLRWDVVEAWNKFVQLTRGQNWS